MIESHEEALKLPIDEKLIALKERHEWLKKERLKAKTEMNKIAKAINGRKTYYKDIDKSREYYRELARKRIKQKRDNDGK